MHRSDRIYLSKFALDQDPEYLDLEDFDLDCEIDDDEFYEKTYFDDEKEFMNRIKRVAIKLGLDPNDRVEDLLCANE